MADAGISVSGVNVDVPKMQDWKNGVVKKMTGGVRGLLKTNKVDLIEGRGKLVGKDKIEVALKSGGTPDLDRRRRASSSRPALRPSRSPASSSTASASSARARPSLKKIPKRLVVIGGA